MKHFIKVALIYWFEIVVGALILASEADIRWFFFYAFVVLLVHGAKSLDAMHKMGLYQQLAHEVKLLAICRKLGISQGEMEIVARSIKDEVGPAEKWHKLEEDWKRLLSN